VGGTHLTGAIRPDAPTNMHIAENFILTLTSILYEALPFIILGAVVAGILEELVPQELVVRLIPRSRLLAIAIGGLLGLLFPMCECGIIPVMRRLLRKGVPLSCCVCYMLAGPIINVVVMMSTYVAFSAVQAGTRTPGGSVQLGGMEMMALRMGLGYLVAIGTSLIVEWQYRKHGKALLSPMVLMGTPGIANSENGNSADSKPAASVGRRLGNIAETSLHDFVDITVYLILGAVLAALSRELLKYYDVNVGQFAGSYPYLAILIMMGMAILLCICSEADAFVAASGGFGFLPPASKLAFLVLGPMLDFKLYMMYTRVFRPRLIWTIITSVVVQVFVVTLITHYVLDAVLTAPPPAEEKPPGEEILVWQTSHPISSYAR
jgi:uncharacterized membrane protein YraQ (UPF0718 family)